MKVKMASQLTNGHIWPPFLITLAECEQGPVKQIEMQDDEFKEASKNIEVMGRYPLSGISWDQHKDSVYVFR